MLQPKKLLEPRKLTVGLLTISIMMVLFLSIAGMVLLTALTFLAATNLYIDSEEDTVKFRRRRHPPWRLMILALESAVALGFAGFAFTRVPLGLVFYIGD